MSVSPDYPRGVSSFAYLIVFLVSLGAQDSFDADIAMAIVDELSLPVYSGRQAGSEGGQKAGDYLFGILGESGYEPRYIPFTERVPVLDGKAELSILVNGRVDRSFAFRKDYREIVRGGFSGGSATGALVLLDGSKKNFRKGDFLLIDIDRYKNETDDETFLSGGAAGVLVGLPAGAAMQRAMWAGQPPGTLTDVRKGFLKLGVSPEAFALLKTAAGMKASVRAASPVSFRDVTCRDILAAWNGNGGAFEPRLVLMAHYDHIGTDVDGERFPGALDNATGAGMVVAFAKSVRIKAPKSDIAFLLTDAEEVNLSGAAFFASNPPFPLSGVTVVNLDMLASASELPIHLYASGDAPSLEAAARLEEVLEAGGIDTEIQSPVPNADHGPFARAGAAAVTACEFDLTVYHRKDDFPARISAEEMEALGEALYPFLMTKARGKTNQAFRF